ncbi:hypothetical protein HMSSN036_88180 [Paenibacillus macerans]|nr:hypothetical protein HMSSN036_88180 [Paenibacillus macerans]
MLKAAEWIADALRRAGMEGVEIHPTAGHPVVYAEHLHAPGKPTILVYGHYDVQPVDPLNLWETPPFEPSIRNGKLYARGATDDKGQVFMHIKAVEASSSRSSNCRSISSFASKAKRRSPAPTCLPSWKRIRRSWRPIAF